MKEKGKEKMERLNKFYIGKDVKIKSSGKIGRVISTNTMKGYVLEVQFNDYHTGIYKLTEIDIALPSELELQ